MSLEIFNAVGVKRSTRAWEKEYYQTIDESGFSDKAKEIAAVIREGDFGCARSRVLKIVSLLLGEDISELLSDKGRRESIAFRTGVAVVPLDNITSHNYKIDVPAIMLAGGDRHAMRSDGTIGNNLTDLHKHLRPATDEEIDKLFAGYYASDEKG